MYCGKCFNSAPRAPECCDTFPIIYCIFDTSTRTTHTPRSRADTAAPGAALCETAMKRPRILYVAASGLLLAVLGLTLVMLESFHPENSPTAPGRAFSAEEEVAEPVEKDPWEAAWANQRQYLQDIAEAANTLRKEVPDVVRKLGAKVAPYENEVNRLFMLSSTYKDNPRVLEAVDRRIAFTGSALQKALAPALDARAEAQELLNKVTQLEKTIPQDMRAGDTGKDMRAYIDTATQVKKRLTDTLARLDNSLTAGRLLNEKIETANKNIDKYMPLLWEKTYLSPPIRYLESSAWAEMPVKVAGTFQDFSLRLPMELPQSAAAWRLAATSFFTVLVFGGILTLLLYRRLARRGAYENYGHIFRTSLPWLCCGVALMASSFSLDGEIYRTLLLGGNTLLIVGQVSLAWDLRRINTPDLPRRSPLWPLCLPALCGYVLMYPGFPPPLLSVAWLLTTVLALFGQRRRRHRTTPLQYETVILQLEPIILWFCLFLAGFGLPRYSILMYMLFISLAVAIQLGMGGMKLIHTAAQHLPETGVKAVLGSIVIACAAPAVLILIAVGMGQWALTLPGGVYLLRHYAVSGFSVGATHFSPVQLLIIISAFYITRTAVSMGSAFLRKMPSRGLNVDASFIPPLQTAFSYTLWALFGLFALKSLGMELSNLAMVAGGLSVGIGFGMQAIVNNFLSGLILIFSRILQEGDVIEVGGLTGTVRKISVRATTVETYDNAVIYVPNSEFVSNRLINWTRNSRNVRRELTVGVAYGTDTSLVMRLLREVANASSDVLKYPPPSVIFADFGNSTLDFKLRFWVLDYDKGVSTESAIRLEVERVFREHHVEVAFPQMDIHVKELPLRTQRAARATSPADTSAARNRMLRARRGKNVRQAGTAAKNLKKEEHNDMD